jgi:hypothetical protein
MIESKQKRCPWPGDRHLDTIYHDEEWGVPVHNDQKLLSILLKKSLLSIPINRKPQQWPLLEIRYLQLDHWRN